MAQNQTMELKQELVKQAERPQNEAKLTKNMSIPDIVKALSPELKKALPETFRDFAPYRDACQFVGCSHTKEKGCAVREALEAGKLQPSRYQSYLRLFEELKPLREWQEKRK